MKTSISLLHDATQIAMNMASAEPATVYYSDIDYAEWEEIVGVENFESLNEHIRYERARRPTAFKEATGTIRVISFRNNLVALDSVDSPLLLSSIYKLSWSNAVYNSTYDVSVRALTAVFADLRSKADVEPLETTTPGLRALLESLEQARAV